MSTEEIPQPQPHPILPSEEILPQPQPHPILLSEGERQKLYTSLTPFVWVLKLEFVTHRESRQLHLTAFAVGNGLLMTCAHGDWDTFPQLKLTGKRLSEKNESYVVKPLKKQANCDMYLLEVEGVKDMNYPKFGSGIIEVGETVLVIGHPLDHVGSGLFGTNAFECVENARTQFKLKDKLVCNKYSVDIMKKPTHRIMANVFNFEFFERTDPGPNNIHPYQAEKKLLARVPIVQAIGVVGGKGASGAPMFNLKGEIVGMHVYGIGGFEISIHCAALKAFVDLVNEGGKGGGGGSSKSEDMEVSKKRRQH